MRKALFAHADSVLIDYLDGYLIAFGAQIPCGIFTPYGRSSRCLLVAVPIMKSSDFLGWAVSNYRRSHADGATFFFTVVTHRRQRILVDELLRVALHDAIVRVRQRYPFTIDAWVLLPDHLHAIWTLPPGDADFGLRWGLIKRLVTRAVAENYERANWRNASRIGRRESTIWQRRFWEHQIRNDADFAAHMDYVHFNPVKHGLVARVQDWPHSTFHRWVAQGIYPLDWAGVDDSPVYQD